MEGRQQLRLLLWKDYLVRKRKVITLAGIIWASTVIFSIHVVRLNIYNEDFPTCTFPARALPSAGMMTFLQSFMCSVTNECTPLDQYQQIPTYEDSKLTQLSRRLMPILNESTLEVASSVPGALKLLATIADVVDDPTFMDISKNGLHVSDLFKEPSRVKRLVGDRLGLNDEVMDSVMDAGLGFQGVMKGSLNRCNAESLSQTLLIVNSEHLNLLVNKLCDKSNEELQKMLIDLLFEVDYSKYLKMLGDMYRKVSGDDRLTTIGNMLTAVVRIVNVENFLPPELVSIFKGKQVDFTYIQLDLIPKLINQFKPIFGDTQSYGIIQDIADATVIGLQYTDKLFRKLRESKALSKFSSNVGKGDFKTGLQDISNVLHQATDVLEETVDKDTSLEAFNALAKITTFITKFLSTNTKHDVLFYSTLLAKLIESANKVIDINMHIEELTYNVTLRHPEAIKVLRELNNEVFSKAFDALSDAERTQILTSKINSPDKMFCDNKHLQKFFNVSESEAETLKKQFCTDSWNSYVTDLIDAFGVFEVRNNINHMASLLIQETLGKDTSGQLYTIDQDFEILKNFTNALMKMTKEVKTSSDWSQVFDKTNSEFMKMLEKKTYLGKQILIVVHGAIAKEIVQQNTILDFKLSPFLEDVIILTSGINTQLDLTPSIVSEQLKVNYYYILKTLMMTALNEKKTYNSLSTPGQDIMCTSVENAAQYLELPTDVTQARLLVKALCNATVAIENALQAESAISKAIHKITTTPAHPIMNLNWNKLINNVKYLYKQLSENYPYIFDFTRYGMNTSMSEELEGMFNEAKEYWFGVKNMERSLHLSLKLALRLLDLLDYDIFGIQNDYWLKIKHAITISEGPISVFDQFVQLFAALFTNTTYTGDLPPTTVAAFSNIIPNIPQLTVDSVDIIMKDDTDIQPIISLLNANPPWPCSTSSLSELLALSPTSKEAVQSLETIFCMNMDFQKEWVEYLTAKNVLKLSTKASTWNRTDYPAHLYLKFSSSLDMLINDVSLVKDTLEFVTHDSTDGHLGVKEAWTYAVNTLNTTDRQTILRKMFNKIDTALNAVNTSLFAADVSTSFLWESFVKCSQEYIDEECSQLGRTAWKYLFGSFSITLENIAGDLLTYFKESNEPNSNFLQLVGFTRGTGLYMLYDKMPEFVGVLLNSYWDYGFMSQIRRASMSHFWDCEAVVSALVPPPGSVIDAAIIEKVQPYVCPSLLHWLSFPRGENVLLDIIAKPQYYFYKLKVENITSSFENAYTKAAELADFITELSKKNQTILTEEDIKMNSIEGKLKKIVDSVLTYKLNTEDPNFRLFNEINFKQFAANIYLTRIVTIVNKLQENINTIEVNQIFQGSDEETKTLEADLATIKYLFKKRSVDAISIHFDILTDMVLNESNTLVDGFNKICNDLQSNIIKTILISNTKVLSQVCSKKYEIIYEVVQNNVNEDIDDARQSLVNLLNALNRDGETDDVFDFLNDRKQILSALKTSIKHSYDLSLPIYLKYLHSNLQSYDVLLSFLAGEDWWANLRAVYNGPYASKFFNHAEKSFDVATDLLTNFDQIHLIRFLRDVNLNDTSSICQPNITLSDYMPDATGLFSYLKTEICSTEKNELFRELPPLLFASQGYESSLRLPREVDYAALKNDISQIESRLHLIKDGPKTPVPPSWVTDEQLQHLRKTSLELLSKQSLTKLAFAVMSNGVDAGTLFINSSQCTICSQLTTWLKQLNLQLFKKQEYDNLLCHLRTITLEDVHHTLKNDFHWDMTIRELISTRNYTKYEMNKSMGEFLGHVRLYLLEDISANSTKLTECLAKNISRNELGNVTLFALVLTHTGKLLRAELPHLHEIDGIKDIPYLIELSKEIAHNLEIVKPLKNYLSDYDKLHTELNKIIEHDLVHAILDGDISLGKVHNLKNGSLDSIVLPDRDWNIICTKTNCSRLANTIISYINLSSVDKALPQYQLEEFWRFGFISNIIEHIEGIVSHGARVLGVASKVDLPALMAGKIDAMLDAGILLLNDDIIDSIVYSLQGLIAELQPVLHNTPLNHDLGALSEGLGVMRQLKTYILEEVSLKIEVKRMFLDPDNIESGLLALGINNTNFWSIAASRIQAGYIHLKPLFSPKQDNVRISDYACQIDAMSKILKPSNLDVVNADDVYAAVVDQFCGLPDATTKQILPVLLRNLNFSSILDQVKSTLLVKLYTSANLTEDEGSAVLGNYPKMAALIPAIQDNIGYMTELFADEPLFQGLRNFSSVGNLLASSDLMSSAGNIMCGKPFVVTTHRLFKQILATPDLNTEPDKAQLDVLPTEYCRSLYKDIINVEGGKIVWSFVKPLLMGKILYTPPHPTAHKIIEKANSSFAMMFGVVNLVHSFANSFPALDKLSSHRDGIDALRNVMSNDQFSSIRDVIIGNETSINMEEFDLDGLFEQFGDVEGIGSLISKLSNLLHCINLNRFQPSPDEQNMTREAAQLSLVNEFTAGVVFLNSENQGDSFTNVEYKIRMDIDNAPTTTRLTDYLWIPGPDANFAEQMRYFRGFIQIQDIIDKAIIKLAAASNPETSEDNVDWAIYTQQIPYPCYTKDYFQTSLYESQSLLVAFFFALLFTVASTIRFIVTDKETGNTMLMSVMGVNLSWHTLSWFIASFIEMVVTMTIITIILYTGRILPNTEPTMVFVLLFIFGLSVLSFCYMISKLFQSASLAAVCGALTYLTTFMPFIIVLSLEAVLSRFFKLCVCLSMSSSFSYALLYINRFEARGLGSGWGQIWESPDEDKDMNIGVAAVMMLFDSVLYFFIGWLIDQYFGIKTLKSNITYCMTTDEKAGVSIVNVTKVYNEGSRKPKVALDNVSIELHKGQLTTLLGHNGAGKTTLINILTGMLKPTKGHVIVRSEHASGTRLGVCPQRDVLYEYMSAREHVTLYAQLNSGLEVMHVGDEVEKMLQVLSLGSVCSEPVVRLSGGTRRRLCVALAFIGKPHLVSLDEPTAGVDPAARSDIWSMIVKLKEDRTILLTTHHLDEAELLSDQIVIMHKGQIHTTGSPIEIKRTLGNGYKLTVIYPERTDSDEDIEEVSQEEKIKQLLTVVRDVVKNANVADVSGLEVEITLPLFDSNGLNNDFLKLCTVLEANAPGLGYKSYSLDCSSLEQVFFNVCQQADAPHNGIEYVSESSPSKSASSSSIKTERSAPQLVTADGPLRGTHWEQFTALMHVRYIHHIRNRWLLFMLVALPTLFVTIAMAFSMLRPPADNEISLRLHRDLYQNSTEFILPRISIYSNDTDPSFAESVIEQLMADKHPRNWTSSDSPVCKCEMTSRMRHICDVSNMTTTFPDMLVLPDVNTMNHWLVDSQEKYIKKRYGGYSAVTWDSMTRLVSWYNNKGAHAAPAHVNALNTAALRARTGDVRASIVTHTHPLKISPEPITKSTVYQHIADAGVTGFILLAYALISAGATIYLVTARKSQEKRLQLLCGVSPVMYWATALIWDMMIMLINICITAVVMSAFGFPVFTAKNNLPAICVLIILYGFACGSMMHVLEKLFSEPSMANMVLFCGNGFLGLSFMAVLLMFDIISESEATDNARYALHKLFMLSPPFALGDGVLEIAKNTIGAEVLERFGMDTYKDPFTTNLILLHCSYLVVVGIGLMLFNLFIEYGYLDVIIDRIRPTSTPPARPSDLEPVEVSEERKRVTSSRLQAQHAPLRVNTIGNINRGFVHTEGSKNSMQRVVVPLSDAAQCHDLTKVYGSRTALNSLTLGIPPRQCTALLGQNGAGKSTTFSLLTGEIRPTSGQIYLNNKLVNPTLLCTGLISYCPQSNAIDSLLTVTETLQFYCRLRGITDQKQVIKRTIEMFELTKYADVRSGDLSGGNKRKLCTAVAFMARTPLVLLDEPTSGMDPLSRRCVSRGVTSACGARRGVLLATHALGDARRLAARVALLRGGELVALDTLDVCLQRFGGGYVVQCRARGGGARAAWRTLVARAPHARLRVLHRHTLHALVPTHAIVNDKEIVTRLSDIFRLMAELQATCDIEDYTINQSSLDEMFLSFTNNTNAQEDMDVELLPPLPSTINDLHRYDDLDSVTAL